jgi:hypothetical protein
MLTQKWKVFHLPLVDGPIEKTEYMLTTNNTKIHKISVCFDSMPPSRPNKIEPKWLVSGILSRLDVMTPNHIVYMTPTGDVCIAFIPITIRKKVISQRDVFLTTTFSRMAEIYDMFRL